MRGLESLPETGSGKSRSPGSSFYPLIWIAVAAGLFYLVSPVIPALIISCLLYVALEPLAAKLCRNGVSRSTTALAITGSLVTLIALSIWLSWQSILHQLQLVYTQLSSIKHQLGDQILVLNQYLKKQGFNIDLSALHAATRDSTTTIDVEILQSSSEIALSIASYCLLIPMILFFLLKDYRSIRNTLLGMLPNRYFELGWLIYYRVTTQLQRYFRGVMIEVLILIILTTLGFYLIGLPSFFILAVCTGVLVIIPYLGLFLSMLIPIVVAWSSNPGDYMMILNIVLVISLTHVHDQVVVVPTVIANAVNLHPLIIILGIILFGYYLGVLGMVIAIPAMAAINIFTESLVNGLQSSRAQRE